MNLFTKYFPYLQQKRTHYSNMVVWGIGANLGRCITTFKKLFTHLARHPKITIHSSAYIYKNKAFGYIKQPNFYNTTLIFSTSLCLRAVFNFMFYLERKFGRARVRPFKNAARKIDIDLIFYGKKSVFLNHMHIPHKDYTQRSSVVKPLTFQLGL